MQAASGGIPVMALGRIGTFELAERVVAEGFGDLVGVGRAGQRRRFRQQSRARRSPRSGLACSTTLLGEFTPANR